MADASSPAPKRRRAFVASPGPGKEPSITKLLDLQPAPKTNYNVLARVHFISMGGVTGAGDEIIGMELADDSDIKEPMALTILGKNNVAAVKGIVINDVVKLRNVRCTNYKGGVSLIVAATDTSFRVSKLKDCDPEAQKFMEAPAAEVCSIDETADMQEGTATLMVRILEVTEDHPSRVMHVRELEVLMPFCPPLSEFKS